MFPSELPNSKKLQIGRTTSKKMRKNYSMHFVHV